MFIDERSSLPDVGDHPVAPQRPKARALTAPRLNPFVAVDDVAQAARPVLHPEISVWLRRRQEGCIGPLRERGRGRRNQAEPEERHSCAVYFRRFEPISEHLISVPSQGFWEDTNS